MTSAIRAQAKAVGLGLEDCDQTHFSSLKNVGIFCVVAPNDAYQPIFASISDGVVFYLQDGARSDGITPRVSQWVA
jgi:hypothetical protein